MTERATLVVVDTEHAELALITELRARSLTGRDRLAPVLARDDLPARLAASLRAAGTEPRLVSAPELPGLAPAEHPIERLPAAIFYSAGVPDAVVRLAGWFAGDRPPRPLPTATELPSAAAGGSALVLLDPAYTSSRAVAAVIEQLDRAGVRTGIVLCDDAVQGRFALLKALLVSRIAGSGRFSVMTGAFDPGATAQPGCLGDPRTAHIAELFERDHDVAVLNGSSYSLCMRITPDLVVCSQRAAPTPLPPATPGVFPCFRDGRCWVQPHLGRDATDRSGLANVDALAARVVVLAGCRLVTPGRSSFDPALGLVGRIVRGPAIATIAGARLVEGHFEHDVLMLALLAEGRTLGHCVADLNREIGRTVKGSGGPQGLHFMLVGNPELTVAGLDLQDASAAADGPDRVRVDLSDVRISAETGALVRCRMPWRDRYPHVRVVRAPSGLWCSGLWYRGEREACFYLWIHGAPGVLDDDGSLLIELSAAPPSAGLLEAVACAVAQVGFWTVLLDAWIAELEGSPAAELLRTTLAEVVSRLRQLAGRRQAAAGPTGFLSVGAAGDLAFAATLWRDLEAVTAILCHAVLEVVVSAGYLASLIWVQFSTALGAEARSTIEPTTESCACGTGSMWRHRFAAPGGAARVVYESSCCGDVGQDDGGRMVALHDAPRQIRRGEILRWSCRCCAAAGALSCQIVLVMECWLQQRRMIGAPVVVRQPLGEPTIVELELAVPDDLELGVYPVVALGVANGVLVAANQYVEVVA